MYYMAYKVSNLINNKVYIGITTDNRLKRRWYEHKWNAKNNYTTAYLYKAINKHGVENFTFEAIACSKKLEDILYIEQQLIIQYNSYGLNGYNCTDGGNFNTVKIPADIRLKLSQESSIRMKNLWKNEEFRDKMSKSLKGKKRSEDSKRKQSEKMKGRRPSEQCLQKALEASIGSKRTEETKNKLKEAQRNRFSNPEERSKISRATKSAMENPEIRKKMSDAATGRIASEETKKKIADGNSSTYLITFPDGSEIIITNLKEFCRKNQNLGYKGMRLVAKGKQEVHRGYKCKEIK